MDPCKSSFSEIMGFYKNILLPDYIKYKIKHEYNFDFYKIINYNSSILFLIDMNINILYDVNIFNQEKNKKNLIFIFYKIICDLNYSYIIWNYIDYFEYLNFKNINTTIKFILKYIICQINYAKKINLNEDENKYLKVLNNISSPKKYIANYYSEDIYNIITYVEKLFKLLDYKLPYYTLNFLKEDYWKKEFLLSLN